MPKRARAISGTGSQPFADSVDNVKVDEIDHTPKWTRSSTSPPPASSMKETNHDESAQDQQMQCILPGHLPAILASAAEFELHYAKEHEHQCSECRANQTSAWMMELHQIENHDPLVAARRERGEKTYRCFLQDCEKVTLTPQKRRLHLIDKHGFPRNYDFRVVDTGSRGRSSLLREYNSVSSGPRRRVNDVGTPGWRDRVDTASNQRPEADVLNDIEEAKDTNLRGSIEKASTLATESRPQRGTCTEIPTEENLAVDDLSAAMSSLSFVPLSVRLRNKKKS